MNDIQNGIYPTMITPFTDKNTIDFGAVDQLIEWYELNKVDGIFAACQSSEVFFLSLEERVSLVRRVMSKASDSIDVVASGHISEAIEDQIEELKAIADTGVKAVVLITNRLAKPGESYDVLKHNVECILNAIPSVSFGLYECPYPYKYSMTPDTLKWCADTGRFVFFKDTSCSVLEIEKKLAAVKNTGIKIFNANSATLLKTLQSGAAGISGVMCNFHPDLYRLLFDIYNEYPEEAKVLQWILTSFSTIERQNYPANAKYYLQLEGLDIQVNCRKEGSPPLNAPMRDEIRQMRELTMWLRGYIRRFRADFGILKNLNIKEINKCVK